MHRARFVVSGAQLVFQLWEVPEGVGPADYHVIKVRVAIPQSLLQVFPRDPHVIPQDDLPTGGVSRNCPFFGIVLPSFVNTRVELVAVLPPGLERFLKEDLIPVICVHQVGDPIRWGKM